ncbi:PadR family transcriptional regulator [Bailinhaonella thermotolerans]|uniref:PadR family transcriptional regulator n=1 Tax=Bailinhaonella thermotolerans TaxID=1070861 RepID=A0A3A4AYK1_9ACTN|nr:PadR family transcriptional regulator [Bailinhaonella thermotolerans]RJL30923.1 PadR family transcriptional regulator [Bailinhaonella thermotolerans]
MSLRHAVLGLLSEAPASGYDLLKIFEMSLANVWPATQSQLYGELGKLTDAGLIEVAAEGPRGRKEYRVTEAGLAELRHWIAEVPPNTVPRSDVLLRVFFLGALPADQAVAYLRSLARDAENDLAHLRSLVPHVECQDDNLSVYGRLALEWGLRASELRREWAEWAEEQIRSLNVTPRD